MPISTSHRLTGAAMLATGQDSFNRSFTHSLIHLVVCGDAAGCRSPARRLALLISSKRAVGLPVARILGQSS